MAELDNQNSYLKNNNQPPVTRGKFFLYGLFILLSLSAIWLARLPQTQATIIDWNNYPLWENVKRLVGAGDKPLQGENEGRINFLLMGEGGPQHDGPYLTDTIMLASLDIKTKTVGLLSIPRDLVVPIDGYGLRRINNANAFGELRGEGQGPTLAKQTISQLVGLPIHYYIRLDFSAFIKLVDDLGGLPINVDQGFTDTQYPGPHDSYITVSFSAGLQTMNGDTALKYARSRHGDNNQGSDFARAKRQQQILLAMKQKILSPQTLFNPRRLLNIYQDLSSGLLTDISAQEIIRLTSLLKGITSEQINHRVLDTSPTGLLKETIGQDGAYLLIPRVSDYSEIKQAAQDILNNSTPNIEQANLIVKNGTNITGLAENFSQILRDKGFDQVSFNNADRRDFPTSLLYDYTGGTKPKSRQLLEDLLHTTAVQLEATAGQGQQPDFIIILGQDRSP